MPQMTNDTKSLIEELGHVLWAAEHPAMMIDRSIISLLQRCEAALRTMSEHDDKDVV